MTAFIHESARSLPVRHDVDTCVIGGGAAGVAAAVSACARGQRVLLVEREGCLGGTLTSVSLGSICGLYAVTAETLRQVVHGFVDQVLAELGTLHAVAKPVRWLKTASLPYDLFAMKLALDRLVARTNVDLLLHTTVVAVERKGRRVEHVIVENKAGRSAIRARTFIDCSGDADVCHQAGTALELDRNHLQQPTAMFRLGGVDPDVVGEMDRASLHRYLEAAVASGMPLPRTAGGVFMERPGIAHLNITKVAIEGRAPDPFDMAELSAAETLGRAQVAMYREAFRRFVPGFEHCYVIDSGAVIGIRESRRLVGRYVLTEDDVRSSRRFDDAIGCCAWPMEDHAAGRATQWIWLEPGEYYQIPYRCLLPQDLDNVLVAGRCASATHAAQASLRVTAQCFAMGQAAGLAAVLSNKRGVEAGAIDIAALQAALQDDGAFLGDVTDRTTAVA